MTIKTKEKGIKLRDALAHLLSRIPMVERPKSHVPLKTKLMFTFGILVLYFVLSNIPLFGLSPESLDIFGTWRAIFAGERFSLTALGVMPIINASIVLQILAGPKIMKLDLTNPKDQAFYLNIQKLLVICFAIFISFTYVTGFYEPDPAIASSLGVSLTFISFLLFLQVFFGGMLIYYLEEVVSRWGIGSGVGLFIVAGVSSQIITGLISWIRPEGGYAIGVIPQWFQILWHGSPLYVEPHEISKGGLVFLFEHNLIAFIMTVALFFLVIYLACARIEIKIPGCLKRRGGRGRVKLPIKFVHFSFAIAVPLVFLNFGRILQMSIQMFGKLLYSRGITLFGTYDVYGTVTSGLMYYLNPIYGPWDWLPPLVHPDIAGWQIAIRIATDMSIMAVGAMIAALLWIKLTPGVETRDIKAMVRDSGLRIYGHNRDLKAIKRAVDRYTPGIAIIGCGVLGALCVIANMFGTLVGAVSMGYLILAVILIYGIYEEIASERS